MSIDHAHEVRKARATTLLAVRSRADVAAFLLRPPDELVGCPVHTVLRAGPYIGDAKVRELCLAVNVWPFDTLGDLELHKRQALAHRIML